MLVAHHRPQGQWSQPGSCGKFWLRSQSLKSAVAEQSSNASASSSNKPSSVCLQAPVPVLANGSEGVSFNLEELLYNLPPLAYKVERLAYKLLPLACKFSPLGCKLEPVACKFAPWRDTFPVVGYRVEGVAYKFWGDACTCSGAG